MSEPDDPNDNPSSRLADAWVALQARTFENLVRDVRGIERDLPDGPPVRYAVVDEAVPYPLGDIRLDLRDFAYFTALATRFETPLPVRLLSSDGPEIPLLPDLGSQRLASAVEFNRPYTPREQELFGRLLSREREAPDIRLREREHVMSLFFNGLKRFVRARFGGVDRARGESPPPNVTGRAGDGGGDRPPHTNLSALTGVAMQRWTVECVEHGRSLYYCGTHSCRDSACYLNAPTWPLDVWLPMGTLYLAADSDGPERYSWDLSEVFVPSMTPFFKTKRF